MLIARVNAYRLAIVPFFRLHDDHADAIDEADKDDDDESLVCMASVNYSQWIRE